MEQLIILSDYDKQLISQGGKVYKIINLDSEVVTLIISNSTIQVRKGY